MSPTLRRIAVMAAVAAVAAAAALIFLAYRQPELLLDFLNLRYCG